MRIAICGPEATGKTTLAEALADALDLPLLEDPRGADADLHGYSTLWEAARHLPAWERLIDRQLDREREFEAGVVDVCAIDAWVLFVRWGWNACSPARVNGLEDGCRRAAAAYDRIVVMPPEQVAPFASHRFLNPAHAARVHGLTRAWTALWGLEDRVVALEPGDADALAERTLAEIQAG